MCVRLCWHLYLWFKHRNTYRTDEELCCLSTCQMKQYFKCKALSLNLICNKLEITTKCNKRLGATYALKSSLKGFASTLKLLSLPIVCAISRCHNNKTTFYPSPSTVLCNVFLTRKFPELPTISISKCNRTDHKKLFRVVFSFAPMYVLAFFRLVPLY